MSFSYFWVRTLVNIAATHFKHSLLGSSPSHGDLQSANHFSMLHGTSKQLFLDVHLSNNVQKNTIAVATNHIVPILDSSSHYIISLCPKVGYPQIHFLTIVIHIRMAIWEGITPFSDTPKYHIGQ